METPNQVPPNPQLIVEPPAPGLTPPVAPKHSGKKIWKIAGSIVAGIFVILILLAWYGSKLEKQDQSASQQATSTLLTTTNNQSNKITMQFPTAQYKDFAFAQNSDILDTAKAYPNLQEYGTPHLEIIKNSDGYSEVDLALHGIQLNIPFGWGSKGGFDTMERIDFFPASSQNDLKQAYASGTPIDLGVKVLNSSGLETTDFNGVLAKIKEISSEGQVATIETDEQNHVFIVKTETINNPNLSAPSSDYSIYMQDPNPNSTAWVAIDIRAPKTEFQKYLGLLGLIYKDIKINWAGLDAYMKGEGQ